MPQVEERTISRVGVNSLMVTLPKGWVAFYRLKPGDRVRVTTNGKLTIEPIKGRKGIAKGQA